MILAVTMNPAIDKVYSIRNFRVGEVHRLEDMTMTAGGKGLNVARVARLLGEDVAAAGFIGGSNGIFIEKEIEKLGIVNNFLHIDGESRICIAIMDRERITSTEILEPGPSISQKDCDSFIKDYEKCLSSFSVITASGSLPSGVPTDLYKILIEKAKQMGKKFILDTSGEYLKNGIKGRPYMVKPNLEEMENIMGKKFTKLSDKINCLHSLKESGIELPCMTLGREGALAVLEDGAYRFSAEEIQVVNTVGSGDSFVAGCATAINRGMDELSIIRLGMACGMSNTQFFKTGFIDEEQVNKFLNMINVERMKGDVL
jgi:tagatose 6-phosphate kinase